jgi:hypothetical protein
MIITEISSTAVHEAPTDWRLPMRQDPLRDHRGTAVGLHVPLHRLPTPDQAAPSRWASWSRRRLSGSAASSRVSYDGSPTAGASTPDWSAQNAAPGSAACRGMACTGSGPAPWMIHPGCDRPGTSGPAESSPGSRFPRAMRSLRNSLPHKAGGHRFQRVWGSGDMPLSTTMTGLLKGMFIDSPP